MTRLIFDIADTMLADFREDPIANGLPKLLH
jgi:hypothetical protein